MWPQRGAKPPMGMRFPVLCKDARAKTQLSHSAGLRQRQPRQYGRLGNTKQKFMLRAPIDNPSREVIALPVGQCDGIAVQRLGLPGDTQDFKFKTKEPTVKEKIDKPCEGISVRIFGRDIR